MNSEEIASWLTVGVGGLIGINFVESLVKSWAYNTTQNHKNYNTLEEIIETVEPTSKRVAVIGSGISGIQAMKSCLEAGIEPVCFEGK